VYLIHTSTNVSQMDVDAAVTNTTTFKSLQLFLFCHDF
jgi:hypothetical protein